MICADVQRGDAARSVSLAKASDAMVCATDEDSRLAVSKKTGLRARTSAGSFEETTTQARARSAVRASQAAAGHPTRREPTRRVCGVVERPTS